MHVEPYSTSTARRPLKIQDLTPAQDVEGLQGSTAFLNVLERSATRNSQIVAACHTHAILNIFPASQSMQANIVVMSSSQPELSRQSRMGVSRGSSRLPS